MHIGTIELETGAGLAPMAGVTDAAMRLEQLEAGARSDDALVRIACAPLAGDMYFRGEGVPKDIQKGAKYWKMAAELGMRAA